MLDLSLQGTCARFSKYCIAFYYNVRGFLEYEVEINGIPCTHGGYELRVGALHF